MSDTSFATVLILKAGTVVFVVAVLVAVYISIYKYYFGTAKTEISVYEVDIRYGGDIEKAFEAAFKKHRIHVESKKWINKKKPYFNAEMGGLVYGARVVLNRRK